MEFGIYLSILVILVVLIPHVNAETTPDWVKNTAGWWAEDAISETEFVNAVEFLVNEGIIDVSGSSNNKTNTGGVPDWVKNTAGWWAEDAISETEFVNAVEFLVNEGIISVTTNTSSSEFYHHTLSIDFSHMFGEFGKEPGKFYKPAGIAVDEEGKVHVADFYNNRIQIFDQNGNFDSKIEIEGRPHGIEVFNNKSYIVKWYGGNQIITESDLIMPHVEVRDEFGKQILTIPGPLKPVDIAIDGIGNIYVSDYLTGTIHIFDQNGNVKKIITILDDNVELLINEKCFEHEICSMHAKLTGITLDNENNIFVTDFLNHRILKLDQKGNIISDYKIPLDVGNNFNRPTNVEFNKFTEDLYITDNTNRVYIFDSNGNMKHVFGTSGTSTGQFNAPHGIAIDELNNIFIAEYSNHRIQVFTYIHNEENRNDLIYGTYENANLVNSDLSYANLSNINLSNKNLEGANLSYADLSYADLSDTNLSNVNFDGAYLYKTNLSNTILESANFSSTSIISCDFKDSHLKDALFKNAKIIDVDVSQESFRMANLEGSDLQNAVLGNMNFSIVNLSHTNLSHVDLSNANLEGANLEGANLTNALLPDNLSNVNFIDVNLNHVNFTNKNLSNSTFLRADLENSILNNSNIIKTRFLESNFKLIDLSKIEMKEGAIIHSDITNVILPDRIVEFNFFNSIFNDVDFSNLTSISSIYTEINMKNGNFENSDFSAKTYSKLFEKYKIEERTLEEVVRNITHLPVVVNVLEKEDHYEIELIEYNTLINADLENANIKNANFSYADFNGANLAYTNFLNTNLSYAYFLNANLEGANLEGANLEGANLEGANLEGANLNCINHEICN